MRDKVITKEEADVLMNRKYADFIKTVGFGVVDGIETTATGYPLSSKEAVFLNEFVGHGNLTQACKIAGLTIDDVGGRAYLADEIKYRLSIIKQQSVADAEEIMQYFTRVMRGEEKDQFGLDAPLCERTAAAKELARRLIDAPNLEAEAPQIRITLNWEGLQLEGPKQGDC